MSKANDVTSPINGLVSRILIGIDKMKTGGTVTEPLHGKFVVEYFEGGKSHPFYWRTAVEMAKVFGGRIRHTKSGKIVKTYYGISELVG